MANKDPVLSYEEFRKNRNNFYLHFVGKVGEPDFIGDIYRSCLPFKRCMKAHPRKFGKLVKKLCAMDEDIMQANAVKLYEAYKVMHPYAKSNHELFK